jgi:hypothetical protein
LGAPCTTDAAVIERGLAVPQADVEKQGPRQELRKEVFAASQQPPPMAKPRPLYPSTPGPPQQDSVPGITPLAPPRDNMPEPISDDCVRVWRAEHRSEVVYLAENERSGVPEFQQAELGA